MKNLNVKIKHFGQQFFLLPYCKTKENFFLCWPSLGGHLFDHLLWLIFQSSLHILQITIFHMLKLCGQLSCTKWSTSCVEPRFYTAPFKLKFLFNYLFSLNNSRSYQDLNSGPPQYQADMLPTELSWLGFRSVTLINEGMHILLQMLDMQCPNRGSKLIPEQKKKILLIM